MGMPAPLSYLQTHPRLGEDPLGKKWVVFKGIVKFFRAICPLPHQWHHGLPWPLFHISLISQQCLPLLAGLWMHIPRAHTLCICEASPQHPLAPEPFPCASCWLPLEQAGCKVAEVSWRDPQQECVNGLKCYLLAAVDFAAPWRVRASCMKLGWRSQNCKTSSQIPAGMRNLATWHSPLFTPLNYFPC